MGKTPIEWATHTSNWLAGCTKVSPACQHCYAETMTARLAAMPNAPARYRGGVIEGRRWTGRVAYDRDALHRAFDELEAAREPRRVFINSMSDTFHPDAPPDSLHDLALEIQVYDQTWWRSDTGCEHADAVGEEISSMEMSTRGRRSVIMLLTKRPEAMLAWQRDHFPDGLPSWVWVGCTVEDQKRADERVPVLLEVDAAVRFLSCEPLLGPINLSPQFPDGSWWQYLDNLDGSPGGGYGRGGRPGGGIGWVIAGGESGPKARPSHPDWFRSLRDQCAGTHGAAGVPFFFKQWGGHGPAQAIWDKERMAWFTPTKAGYPWHENRLEPLPKHKAGRLLDGVTHDAVPEVNDG
jgi:protein gp37